MPLFFIVLAIAQADAGDVSDVTRVPARRRGDRLRHRRRRHRRHARGGGRRARAAGIGFVDDAWLQVVPVAAAVLAYSVADALGGSGFIAAFVGGMVFGGLRRRHGGEVGYLIEELGGVLNAITFLVFGAVMLGPALGEVTWAIAAYAVLSPHARADAPGRDRDARHRRAAPDGRLPRLVRASRAGVDRLRRDPRSRKAGCRTTT